MYAHRNEDIVNIKHGVSSEKVTITHEHNLPLPVSKRKAKANEVTGKENIDSSMNWKKREFSFLARHIGMGELEFSKWLLAASSAQREMVLQNYLKSKDEKPIR